MKAIALFMAVVAALLLVVTDASALGRGRQVVKQKTVVRGGAARGLGGANIKQTTIVGGGASVQAQQSVSYGAGIQRSFVRQRSFMSSYAYAAPAIQAQVFAAPVYQAAVMQQVQVQAAPVVYQAPAIQLQAAPVCIQAAPVVLQAPVYAPAVQLDTGCVAPALGVVRQRTFMRGY